MSQNRTSISGTGGLGSDTRGRRRQRQLFKLLRRWWRHCCNDQTDDKV